MLKTKKDYKTFKMNPEDHKKFTEIAKRESRPLIDQFHIIIEKYDFFRKIVLPE